MFKTMQLLVVVGKCTEAAERKSNTPPTDTDTNTSAAQEEGEEKEPTNFQEA